MSTKTTFKRIALVAAASLGFGVLSAIPSQATFTVAPTLTTAAGSPTKAKADSTNAGSINYRFFADATSDTVAVTASAKTFPTATVPRLNLYFGDTVGSSVAVTAASAASSTGFTPNGNGVNGNDSISATVNAGVAITTLAGWNQVNLLAQLDTTQARSVGSYVFTVVLTTFTGGLKSTQVSADLTLTVAALSSESTVASAGNSAAYIHNAASGTPTADNTSTLLATASTTARAWLYVNLVNTGGGQASESVTITTTIGNFGPSGGVATGKSLTVEYASGGAKYYPLFADGTAGTAVITVKSASVTFANKSVTFYAANPTTLVARALNSTPGVGTNSSAVEVVAKDSNGVLWGGSLNIYSDTLGTISDTGTACTNANTTVGAFLCPVTGVVAGTAKVKAYAAAQTVVSNEVSLTVKQATAATVKLSFDKASYAPGEKAVLMVEVLDSAGNPVQNGTFANLFATGGITLSTAAGNGSDTLTAVSITTSTAAQNYVGTSTTGSFLYTVYMPPVGGTITASATGGTSLPVAGQVKVTATATIADSGSAALAAVTALASQVSAFITKINAQITTLTDLVMKIQKKVKA